MKCNYRNRRKYEVFIVLVLLGCSIYLVSITNDFYIQSANLLGRGGPLAEPPKLNASSGFMVNTPGCRIPAMDPFDSLVKKFIEKVTPIDCAANSSPQLVKSNLTSLYVDHTALAHYNVSDADQLECCYIPFLGVDGDMSNYSSYVDDEIRYGTKCIHFQSDVIVDIEFLKVECQINGTKIYTDYHSFPPFEDANDTPEDGQTTGDSLSVLVIGIDGVSRLNFHRQMPLTEAFLREMGAIEMLGYNKVADDTFPNLIPVLSGMTEEELMKTCWKADNASFDSCPWLWKNYSAAGYTTAFGEDTPGVGIFNYLKARSVQQLPDYNMQPYNDTHGDNTRMNPKPCIGPPLAQQVLLQYASKFAQTMTNKQYFGIFLSGSLYNGNINYAKLGDSLHKTTLRHLADIGALNRTLLIVVSSHGNQLNPISETYQGRLEERLPLLSLVFPSWFRDKYSNVIANLRGNAHRLTTPFDLHDTLLDLLSLSLIEEESPGNMTESLDHDPPSRVVSLFRPISENRTCSDAGIPANWCTCHENQGLAHESKIVKKMAFVLVKHVNNMLKQYRACVQLKLHTVHYAQMKNPKQRDENNTMNGSEEYVLVVQTTPGNALLEAAVRKWQLHNITVLGSVNRINLYGNQSFCVNDSQIKPYCFCDSFYNETLF